MNDLANRPVPREELPRVQYGWYLKGSGGRFPLWAYSISELDEAERERSDLQMLLWPPDAEIHARLRAKFARLRTELQDQIVAHGVGSPKSAGRRPADSRIIALPQRAKAANSNEEELTSPATQHVAPLDGFEGPAPLAGLGEEIRALLGELQQLGEHHAPNPPSGPAVAEVPAPERITPTLDTETGVLREEAEPDAVVVLPHPEPAVVCDMAERDAVAVPPSPEPAEVCDTAAPEAVAVPPCSEAAKITAKTVRRRKAAPLPRSKAQHRVFRIVSALLQVVRLP